MSLYLFDKVTVTGDHKDIITRWDLGKCLEKSVKSLFVENQYMSLCLHFIYIYIRHFEFQKVHKVIK